MEESVNYTNALFALFLLGNLLGRACAQANEDAKTGSIQLSVTVTHRVVSSGDILLKVSVKNLSKKQIELKLRDLPWNGRSTMPLILRNADLSDQVLLRESIDSCTFLPLGEVSLRPGEAVSGDVSLLTRTTDWNTIKRNSIDVFWSYQTATTSGETSDRQGGYLFVNRKR